MAPPKPKVLTLIIEARIDSNACVVQNFELKVNSNNPISDLDDAVKKQLKEKCPDVGTKSTVEYMFKPRGSRPYVVERDGKDTVSQLFPPSKTLKVLAIVSDATVQVMHFARTGSQRQAASKTNKNVMLCNRVDIFDKGKQKRENAAHKAKKEVARKRRENAANQPAKKRPMFKGRGRTLCDSDEEEFDEEEFDEDSEGELDELDKAIRFCAKGCDKFYAPIISEFDSGEMQQVSMSRKMGKGNVVGSRHESSFIEQIADGTSKLGKEARRSGNPYRYKHYKDNLCASALSQVFHGHYRIERMTIAETAEKGYGRKMSDGTGQDPSEYMRIRFRPAVGSVKDGGRDGSGKEYSLISCIMRHGEMTTAIKDIYSIGESLTAEGIAISGKYVMRPEVLIQRFQQLFWSVVFHTQPEVVPENPKTERLQFDAMLSELVPEIEWDYLRSGKTRSSIKW